LFRKQRLVIEIDGEPWHKTNYRRQTDARKQALVEATGHRVIRLNNDDVADEPQTVARIRHALP
jgi:very-short-patch-repair endonuclease